MVALRHECPLAIGLGAGEQFVASSTAAFLPYTHKVVFLRDGDLVELHADEVKLIDAHGSVHVPIPIEVDWGEDSMEKEGFETFMLKEIYEQPAAIGETLSSYRSEMQVEHPRLAGERLREVRQIRIVACGTSFHAGLAGRLAIERWARIPVEVDVASEFRYQDPIIERGTLVLGITQSGETADTLAAMRLARERGATVVAVTNVAGSQATREADAVLFTRAGLELGVAATKTFVAQVVLLYEFALQLAVTAGSLSAERQAELHYGLELLPERLGRVLAQDRPRCARPRRAPGLEPVLPVPGSPGQPAGGARGRPQAQGDLIRPDRRIRGRGDEARSNCPARRARPRSSRWRPRRACCQS